MAGNTLGDAAPSSFAKETTKAAANGERVPGLGWQISEGTQREIDVLEDCIRTARQRSGFFLLD